MDAATPPILLAQCKAYQSLEEITTAINNLIKIQSPNYFNIHISLPYSFIEPLSKKFATEQIAFGAELLLDADEGSFTASIAGKMLEQPQVKFALIGTAQDRISSSSRSHQLKNKIKAALEAKVLPFICIGETWHEHQDKTSKEVLTTQLKECLEGFSLEELHHMPIVYNAEWISQTPWEATSPELEEAYKVFKEVVSDVLHTNDQNNLQLILSVPAYSEELAKLILSLQTPSYRLLGYSLGVLGLSSQFLRPLENKIPTLSSETAFKELTPIAHIEAPIVQPEAVEPQETIEIPVEAPRKQPELLASDESIEPAE